MEENFNIQPDDLVITPEISVILEKTAKWARFIGIVIMAIIGLMVLLYLTVGSAMLRWLQDELQSTYGNGMYSGGFTVFITFFYGVIFAFGLYFGYLLFNFGSKVLYAVRNKDYMALKDGLESHRKFYTLYGIILAVYLGFLSVGLVVMVLGALSGILN